MKSQSFSRQSPSATGRQRGLTIIELLIGVAVGLMVVAGAVKLMADTLGGNRRLLLETRVNQDLRTAADLIARDIRRAGYWVNATTGVFTTFDSSAVPNPHRHIYTVGVDDTKCLSPATCYDYGRNADDVVQDAERAGFQVSSGVLEFRNGAGGWQAITDPKVVTITTLAISPLTTSRVIELYNYCACLTKLTCIPNQFKDPSTVTLAVPYATSYWSTRPRLFIRQFNIVLRGQSTTDATVIREIRESVRSRNDQLEGSCPAV
jgi:type IV pilus assembly protein PilW